MRIFLAAYTIRVHGRRKTKNEGKVPPYRKLSAYDGHKDLYEDIVRFLEKLEVDTTDKTHMLYMKPKFIEYEERIISGVFESGNYGRSSNILDIKTDSVAYKKKWEDADVLPFYFLFYIPKDTDEGFLLLQRTGRFGIKKNLGRFLSNFFHEENKDFFIELNALIREELVKKVLRQGTIKKLRCVKYKAPTDRVDGFDEGHKEVPLQMEVVLSANKIPFKEKIVDLFNPKTDSSVKSLIELRDFNFNYDTVKVEVDVGGSIKTFDLGSLQKVRTYYDITDSVKLKSDNQPTLASIKQATRTYLKEVIDDIYH